MRNVIKRLVRSAEAAGAGACLLLAVAVACSGAADKWTGSVDAVFRYRPGDRSTLVYEVRPGSAAALAGLAVGDRVLTVDGEDVTEAAFEAVRAAMRGPVGSVATLTVQRDGKVTELTIERRRLREDSPPD